MKDLESLRKQQQNLESARTANENERSEMDKSNPRYNDLVQESKRLDTQITTNKAELTAAERQAEEVKKAKEAAVKEEGRNVVKSVDKAGIEAENTTPERKNPQPFTDPSKADPTPGKLDKTMKEGIEATNQGKTTAYQNKPQQHSNSPMLNSAKEKADKAVGNPSKEPPNVKYHNNDNPLEEGKKSNSPTVEGVRYNSQKKQQAEVKQPANDNTKEQNDNVR